MPNDRTTAPTKGRTSLGSAMTAPETAGHDTTPTGTAVAPPALDTPVDEPHAGGKRTRSDSASSLSTQPITSLPAASTPAPATRSKDPEGPARDGQGTALPAENVRVAPAPPTTAQPVPHTPERPQPRVAPDAHPPRTVASPTISREASQSPPYQVRMTPTYVGRLTGDTTPPPHHLEPVFNVFHTDVPQLIPNPNHPHRPTDETLARLLALRSQRTRKCDPQDSLTTTVPTPRYGWPRVYHASPDFLYANLPESTLDKWLAADSKGKKVIVQVMRQNSWSSPQCDHTANLIVKTLEAIFGVEKIKVATASEDIRGRSQQNAPFSFLVFGLSSYVAEKILDKHCFATEHIQFLAYPLIYAATPTYLGSLSGLRNLGETPDDMEVLRDSLSHIFLRDKKMHRAILAYAEDVAATTGDAIMDSSAAVFNIMFKFHIGILETKSHGGVDEPTVNMYLELPASAELDRAFPNLVEAASRLTFETPLSGNGRFFAGFFCLNCRGMTHPTGLCPFEAAEGWDDITRPGKGDLPAPPSSHPGPPPPPPPHSPRNQGPPPPRRDHHASSSKLPAPSFHSSRGRPTGRG